MWFLAFTAMMDPTAEAAAASVAALEAAKSLRATPTANTSASSSPVSLHLESASPHKAVEDDGEELDTLSARGTGKQSATQFDPQSGSNNSSPANEGAGRQSPVNLLVVDAAMLEDSSQSLGSPRSRSGSKRRTSRRFSRSFDGDAEFNSLQSAEEGDRADIDSTAIRQLASTSTSSSPLTHPVSSVETPNSAEVLEVRSASPTLAFGSPATTRTTVSTPVREAMRKSPTSLTSAMKKVASSMALSKKEEQARKQSQLQLLSRAFEVLDRMKIVGVKRDALVYRALIDAACRVGSTHHALLVLREMRQNKMRPDSLFFSCLLSAFAMDGTLGSIDTTHNTLSNDGQMGTPRAALPMGELAAWMKETAEGGGDSTSERV